MGACKDGIGLVGKDGGEGLRGLGTSGVLECTLVGDTTEYIGGGIVAGAEESCVHTPGGCGVLVDM